jgi:hypothetical protein
VADPGPDLLVLGGKGEVDAHQGSSLMGVSAE